MNLRTAWPSASPQEAGLIVHGGFEPKTAAGGCEEAQQASPTHVAKHVQVNARACASRAQIKGR